jgi:hypothetical protein
MEKYNLEEAKAKLSKKIENWTWKDQAFWWVRYGIWEKITDLKWRVPNALQRMWRGWGNADTWSFDYYLAQVIRDGVKHLRANQHGIPSGICKTYTAEDQAIKEWDIVLDKIIIAFDLACRNIDDLDLTKEEEEKMKEGMRLFTENFFNLWD